MALALLGQRPAEVQVVIVRQLAEVAEVAEVLVLIGMRLAVGQEGLELVVQVLKLLDVTLALMGRHLDLLVVVTCPSL